MLGLFMRGKEHHLDIKKLSFAGLIITLGVVYGDLGTSPLYTMRAILLAGKDNIHELLIYGSLSCIFWTLTLQTTIKYVLITLQADNNGEGGIFALFALIRKKSSWASPRAHWLRRALPLRGIGSQLLAAESASIKSR